MVPLPPAAGRRSRLLLVGAALLVLVAVVAFASRSGFGSSAKTAPTQGFVDWALQRVPRPLRPGHPGHDLRIFFSGSQGRRGDARASASRVLRNILSSPPFFVARLLYYLKRITGTLQVDSTSPGNSGGKRGRHTARVLPSRSRSSGRSSLWIGSRHRHDRQVGGAPPPAQAHVAALLADGPTGSPRIVAASIDDAIDDLEAEPDARRAVIAAYARMEAVLGRSGVRRAPSETPLEYLDELCSA